MNPEVLAILEALDRHKAPYQTKAGVLRVHKDAVLPDSLAAQVDAYRDVLGAFLISFTEYKCNACKGLITGTLAVVDGQDYHEHCAPMTAYQRRVFLRTACVFCQHAEATYPQGEKWEGCRTMCERCYQAREEAKERDNVSCS